MWKDIDDTYEVSDNGEVKNKTKKRLLTVGVHSKGYFRVNIHGKPKFIHRLVAEAFLPNIKNLPQVNHKDADKANNNVNNLEWCDNRHNIRHGVKNGCYEKYHKTLVIQEKEWVKY